MSKEKLTPEEELRIQNEIEALKLEMNHGAKTFISDEAPPEIIEQWLKQVSEFENMSMNGELISIKEYIGVDAMPQELNEVEKIDKKELKKTIAQFEELLGKKRIVIDRPEHLTDIGWYHFLVTDFFPHEIVNFSAPNYVNHLNYDDFRHDGINFIMNHAQDVIEDIIDLSRPYEGVWLSDPCRSDQEMVSQSVIIDKINAFRAQYDEIDPIAFEIDGLEPHPTAMYVLFGIKWDGIRAQSRETEEYEGVGICQMTFDGEEWLVEGGMMPGFEF